MKKLLTATCAIMLGIVANAASFTWSIDYSYVAGTSDNAEGWLAVFFDNADMARGNFIDSLADGTYIDNINKYGGLASDLTDEDGYADGLSKRNNYGNPETIEGYFVLFNSDDAATATFAYVSALDSATTGGTDGQRGAFEFGDITDTKNAGNWTAVAPEPTSGLLLLLGMAGLALKRKRA